MIEVTPKMLGVILVGLVAWTGGLYAVVRGLLMRFVAQLDVKLDNLTAGLRQGDKDRQRLELQLANMKGEFVRKGECAGCQSKLEKKLDQMDQKFDAYNMNKGK